MKVERQNGDAFHGNLEFELTARAGQESTFGLLSEDAG
jgi:hypothetical protein